MSTLALAAAATLLVSGPVNAQVGEAVWLGAHGGFLLGNAHRCGVERDRVVKAGELMRDLIAAASRDGREKEDASTRFAEFFLATAYADQSANSLVASCKAVTAEFKRFEEHSATLGAAERRSSQAEFNAMGE